MEMKSDRIVSVIIPSYGKPDKLSRAVDSILSQSVSFLVELIVVDDNGVGTTNQKVTEKILSKKDYSKLYDFQYVKLLENEERSNARNVGIKKSSGDYLMFLDNDDYFAPHKVEKQLKKMLENKGCHISYTKYARVYKGDIKIKSKEEREGNLLLDALARNLMIHAGSNLMVSRSLIDEIGGFDIRISNNEDIEFLVRALDRTKLLYVDYLGLFVDIEDKSAKVPNDFFFSSLKNYLKIVEPFIDGLNDNEKKYLKTHFILQTFKHYLQTGQYRKAFCYMYNSDINTITFIKYTNYLVNRYITRTAYGFILK